MKYIISFNEAEAVTSFIDALAKNSQEISSKLPEGYSFAQYIQELSDITDTKGMKVRIDYIRQEIIFETDSEKSIQFYRILSAHAANIAMVVDAVAAAAKLLKNMLKSLSEDIKLIFKK